MLQLREELGRVRQRWTEKSWLVQSGRRFGEQVEGRGFARSVAGTDPAPPRGGERLLPSPVSDTQRGRKMGEGGRNKWPNKVVDAWL